MSGCALRAHLRQVVSELDSCLYILDEGDIRGKEHSDTRQVVSELDSCLYISDEGGIRGKEHSDTRQVVSEHNKDSLLSIAEKGRIHHASKEKR
jgi:hypothetical protein